MSLNLFSVPWLFFLHLWKRSRSRRTHYQRNHCWRTHWSSFRWQGPAVARMILSVDRAQRPPDRIRPVVNPKGLSPRSSQCSRPIYGHDCATECGPCTTTTTTTTVQHRLEESARGNEAREIKAHVEESIMAELSVGCERTGTDCGKSRLPP